MIVFGSGGDVVHLGQGKTEPCPTCERERPFSLILQYSYEHVWYIFAFVSKKQYFYVCDICHRGAELDAAQVERELGRVPIPFMRRFGCLVMFALIGLLVLFGALSGGGRR